MNENESKVLLNNDVLTGRNATYDDLRRLYRRSLEFSFRAKKTELDLPSFGFFFFPLVTF